MLSGGQDCTVFVVSTPGHFQKPINRYHPIWWSAYELSDVVLFMKLSWASIQYTHKIEGIPIRYSAVRITNDVLKMPGTCRVIVDFSS